MPKSGSTFLSMVTREITGYEWFPMNFAYWQLEHDMYLPSLLRSVTQNTVTQQHVKGSDSNIDLMEIFGIRPVIMVRNIFDVVVSYRDHIHKYRVQVPPAFLNDRFFDLADEAQFDLIIDMFMPWYISFFASWYDISLSARLDHIWIRYEEMIGRTHATFRKVFEFYNLPVTDGQIDETISKLPKWKVGYNKGVSGRGLETLTKDQQKRITELTKHYPWVDFTMIGIDTSSKDNAPKRNFHLYRSHALNYHAEGEFEKAAIDYKRALSIRPDDVSVLVSLGNAHRAGGDFRSARMSYMEAIRYDPESSIVWASISRLAADQNDQLTAREALEKAARLNPGTCSCQP